MHAQQSKRMKSEQPSISLWGLATETVLPLLASEKKTEFLDLLLKDEESRSYLLEKLTPDVVKRLTEPTEAPLDDDDIVLITYYMYSGLHDPELVDDRAGRHVYLPLTKLPWRIKTILKELWLKRRESEEFDQAYRICKNDYLLDDTDLFTGCYIDSILEKKVLYDCIPQWEDPGEHDISDFAQPGTVLYDAYVYHAVGNEDSVIEKVQEGLQRLFDDEHEYVDFGTQRWIRNPRVQIHLITN